MFEKIGKFFFSKVSVPFFLVLIAGFLFFSVFYTFLGYQNLKELQERFAAAARKEHLAIQRKERKERFLQKYINSNPYFLDQYIESYPLLEKERKKIESLLSHPAFPNHPNFQQRLLFLKENKLLFAEENIKTSGLIKEVEEKQRHPVQVDENDLKKILSLIEGVPITPFDPPNSSPQLILQDFRMKKIKTALQTETFEIDMQILKREFTKS